METRLPSIDNLLALIRAAIEHVEQVLSGLSRSAEQARDLRNQASTLGIEGTAAQIAAVSDAVEESQARASSIGTRLRGTLAAAQALSGNGGSAPPPQSGGSASPQPPERPWSTNPPVRGFRPERPHPTCIEQTRRVGWPLNHNGRVSARGRLYDADGRPITGTVQAGAGPATHTTGLREPWASDPRMTTRWHIEGHAAAIMRQHQLKESVLYINIPPCGAEDQDEWRCDSNIAKIIPPGSTLRVWVARQNGSVSRLVYRGTGEALQ